MNALLLGLTERDFDAYLPERATSNAYSRPRLEFKQRALVWVRSVVSRLLDIDISVDIHASDEHPSVWNGHRVDCQWVFLWRDAATRADLEALLDQRRGLVRSLNDPSPFFRHAFLALRIDHQAVEVCVQVHPNAWVDFETLKARLSDEVRAMTVLDCIHELPEQFSVGLYRDEHAPCASVTRESLTGMTRRCEESDRALWIGWSVPRSIAVQHSDLLNEQLGDALVALAPVYRQTAWSQGDDPAHFQERMVEMRSELTRVAAERAAELERMKAETDRQRREITEKSRERTRERVDYDATRPRPTLGSLFKPDSGTSQSVPAKREAPQPRHPAPQQTPRGANVIAKPVIVEDPIRPHARKPVERSDGDEPIEKGVKVKVLAGPFSGKVGVVSDIDARGGARILLGLLSARVALVDLAVVVETKDRPAFQTSHRRPMPAARPPKEQRDK